MRRVVIVGAGLGGLSAACHLSGRQGYEVTLLERARIPGGRAGVIELGGYRMDPGPVVLTMPDILENVFRAAGAASSDHVRVRPLDPMYRGVFDDGSQLRLRHGVEAMTEEIRSFAGPKEAANFGRFAAWLTELNSVETPNFIDRNFDSVLDLVRPLSPGLKLLRLGGFRKLHRLVAEYFSDPRLQKMFSFQAMYAGLSPFQALGAYAIITYMDSIAGVYCAEGGIHAVSTGLADAAEKAGVHIRYGENVERVLQANGTHGAVRGVLLASGEVIAADVVVVNADTPVAYTSLLPQLTMPRVLRTGHYSPSCALWLAGVKGQLPADAEHHNIHFGSQWRESFNALLNTGERQPDPSILVTIPTVSDPALAPAGSDVERHVLYVLEPTPNLSGRINWDTERERVQADLRRRVGAAGYPVEVEVETFFDPTDWERQGMALGTPFALSHRFFQTGPFRARNIERRVPGLVFVGSSTVPGVGVPMVLLSGRLAALRVDQYAAA